MFPTLTAADAEQWTQTMNTCWTKALLQISSKFITKKNANSIEQSISIVSKQSRTTSQCPVTCGSNKWRQYPSIWCTLENAVKIKHCTVFDKGQCLDSNRRLLQRLAGWLSASEPALIHCHYPLVTKWNGKCQPLCMTPKRSAADNSTNTRPAKWLGFFHTATST